MTPDPPEENSQAAENPSTAETVPEKEDPESGEKPATDGAGPEAESVPGSQQTGRPQGVEPADAVDWRGWVLVGLVFVCFLVIPGIVLYIPQSQGLLASIGLSRRQAYLAFPMIPAIVLGITAVWAAVRTQTPD